MSEHEVRANHQHSVVIRRAAAKHQWRNVMSRELELFSCWKERH
jgi:hypothetical protein